MTYPDTNPGRRAELLRAAYGMDRALELAERRAGTLSHLAGGEYWEEVAQHLSAMTLYAHDTDLRGNE